MRLGSLLVCILNPWRSEASIFLEVLWGQGVNAMK